MKKRSKYIALFLAVAMFNVPCGLFAAEPFQEGYAYEGTYKAATISPWYAVGAVVLIAGIVALCVDDGHHHSGHSH